MNCFLCERPMAFNGGLQYYHGSCRKQARYKYGSMSKLIRIERKKRNKRQLSLSSLTNKITLEATKWQLFKMWLRKSIKKYVRL